MSMYRRRLMIANALKRSDGNINYPGLIAAWSAKGKTNDDEDRATLKDLTGNGHDITLNGFAFSGMSGYNVYTTDFSKWAKSSGGVYNIVNKHKINIISSNRIGIAILYADINNSSIMGIKKQKYKVQGLLDNQSIILGNDTYDITLLEITTDGEYEVDWSENQNRACCILCNFVGECNITIEVIPEYPDALVFDGVDDYGINENMPILTDYTIIAKRIHLGNGVSSFIAKQATNIYAAFNFENIYLQDNVQKFRSRTYVSWKPLDNFIDINNISYQTANYYNNIKMVDVVTNDRDSNIIKIGSGNFAFYSAYLFDRSLDEQEIKAFIRKYIDPEYLLPSEIPTPDCYYDLSQGSNDDENRETIKDYSGNGKDAKAYNFDWSGMSGYGGYNWNFNNFIRKNYEHTSTKVIIDTSNKPSEFPNVFENYIYDVFDGYINKGCRIKVSGITGNGHFKLYNGLLSVTIQEDGEYSIGDYTISQDTQVYYGFNALQSITNNAIVTIELLPEYPGALVFDGVDDYVSLDAFDSGFKTMFMVWNWFKPNTFGYDQRDNTTDNENCLSLGGIAIYCQGRNVSGKTYINGILNTKITTNNMVNKNHLITSVFTGENTNVPKIGSRKDGLIRTNMALYKFLGFKEALTEEQIQAVIKKYNLLDGVDEIEVS